MKTAMIEVKIVEHKYYRSFNLCHFSRLLLMHCSKTLEHSVFEQLQH